MVNSRWLKGNVTELIRVSDSSPQRGSGDAAPTPLLNPILPEMHRNARRLSPLTDPPLDPASTSGVFFQTPEEPCHDSNTSRPHIIAERKTGLGRRGVDYLDLLA